MLFPSSLFLDQLRAAASCGQQLVMFDAQGAKFRSIKLRPKQAGCAVCGETPSVTQLVDYEAFCGAAATDKVAHNGQIPWVTFVLYMGFFYAQVIVETLSFFSVKMITSR